jgi:predicted transcriptional regulator
METLLGGAETNLRILLRLKERYGDLNCALIGEYLRAYGETNVNRISQDVGLNRSVVARCIQALSESGIS